MASGSNDVISNDVCFSVTFLTEITELKGKSKFECIKIKCVYYISMAYQILLILSHFTGKAIYKIRRSI